MIIGIRSFLISSFNFSHNNGHIRFSWHYGKLNSPYYLQNILESYIGWTLCVIILVFIDDSSDCECREFTTGT